MLTTTSGVIRALLSIAALAAGILASVAALPASAGERLSGPIPATVEKVIDGDTIAVRVRVWIGQEVLVLVRVAGVDVPELAKGCAASRALAIEAKSKVEGIIEGHQITLFNIQSDKYFGRVVADVRIDGSGDLASLLLADGLARPYGGKKRCGWCGEADSCPVASAG